jgi:hypothetical protein
MKILTIMILLRPLIQLGGQEQMSGINLDRLKHETIGMTTIDSASFRRTDERK